MKNNWKSTRASRALLSALAIGMSLENALIAQDQGAADDEIFELSPFQVDASQDRGYRANNTLAGTRTASSLKDVAAAVTVVTEQFLKDTGATNINELFSFLPNAEGTDYYTEGAATLGGSNAFFGTGNSGQQQPGASNGGIPETGTNRLRGLENVTVSRDFYQTNIPVDTYNIERAELNRGPNSILFGLGKSSGILNYSLKRAHINKDLGELTIRIGDEDTFRTTLDYNKVINKNDQEGTGLAIRLVGLYEQGGFRKVEPAFDYDRRFFGSIRWKPFRKTDINLNYELYDRQMSRPSNVLPYDAITPWVNAGMPTWDPSVGGSLPNGLSPFNARPGRGSIMTFWDSADAWESGEASRVLQTISFKTPSGTNSVLATSNIQTGIPFNSVGNSLTPDSPVLKQISRASTDPSNRALNDDNALSLSINQALMNNASAILGGEYSLNAQVSYFRERVNLEFRNAFHEDFPIIIDVNEKIPTGAVDSSGQSVFVTNPNFLRPFSMIRQNFQTFRNQDQETRRIEATYDLKFPESQWFNRAAVTALVQERETEDLSVSLNNQFLTSSQKISSSSLVNAGSGSALLNTSHALYIGPPVSLSDPIGSFRLDRLPSARSLDMVTDSVVFYDANSNRFDSIGQTRSVPAGFGFGGAIGQEISTAGITLQSFLLNNKLVATYGYRKDTVDQTTSGGPQSDPFTKLFIEDSLSLDGPAATKNSTEGSTNNLGLVAHPFNWLSFHYNDAENFSPEGQRVDFLGNFLGNPTGEGKDYGFTLNLIEDKMSLKFNWYDASQAGIGDNSATSFGQFNIGTFERNLQRELAERGQVAEYRSPEATNPELFGPQGWVIRLPDDPLEGSSRFDIDPRYRATTSFEAEGLEVELIYNPTNNWRIMANAAQQETVQGLIGPRLQEYIDARLPYWQSLSIWNQTSPFVGPTTPSEAWQQSSDLFQNIRINENKLNDQLREWRFNVISSYDFTEGILADFSIGGAARWLDESVVGFGTTTGPTGATILDPKQPFYSDSIFDVNLWFKYSTRFMDIPAEFQINFDNILEGDKLRIANRNADGTVKQYSYNPPKRVSLTARFRF